MVVRAAAATMDARIPTAQRVERTWRSLGGDTYLTATERTNAVDRRQVDVDVTEVPLLEEDDAEGGAAGAHRPVPILRP